MNKQLPLKLVKNIHYRSISGLSRPVPAPYAYTRATFDTDTLTTLALYKLDHAEISTSSDIQTIIIASDAIRSTGYSHIHWENLLRKQTVEASISARASGGVQLDQEVQCALFASITVPQLALLLLRARVSQLGFCHISTGLHHLLHPSPRLGPGCCLARSGRCSWRHRRMNTPRQCQ